MNYALHGWSTACIWFYNKFEGAATKLLIRDAVTIIYFAL